MTVISTIAADAEHYGAEAFESAIAETRVVAPAALGFAGRAGGLFARVGVASVPGLGTVSTAWAFVTSPAGKLLLALLTTGAALGFAYWKGHEAAVQSEIARKAVEAHAEDLLVIDKLQSDAATVRAAMDATAAAKAASDRQIARLNVRIAAAPKTKSCPPILLDTIRGLGSDK